VDRDEALRGSTAPEHVLACMTLIDVPFVDVSGAPRTGQLVVAAALAGEVEALFARMVRLGFPLERVVPICAYGWDDDASMAANNTSGFNYRLIGGTDQPSMHSWGAAIDVNPALNPFGPDPDAWSPPGATWDPVRPGTLARDAPHAGRLVIEAFEDAGWTWLGDPDSISDRHHFQKTGFTLAQ
jgi:poly-gamma-glutamate synthesis protein (capsule biosynthesis protein)